MQIRDIVQGITQLLPDPDDFMDYVNGEFLAFFAGCMVKTVVAVRHKGL